MKFGIFYEHQLPRGWDEYSEHKLLNDSLKEIELADKLGFDYAWEVEHHFLEEYSHSSAPEVFLAACSQRTKNIRLGQEEIERRCQKPMDPFDCHLPYMVIVIDELADLIREEVGKPITFARGEVARAVETFTLGAEEVRRWGGEVVPVDIQARTRQR